MECMWWMFTVPHMGDCFLSLKIVRASATIPVSLARGLACWRVLRLEEVL